MSTSTTTTETKIAGGAALDVLIITPSSFFASSNPSTSSDDNDDASNTNTSSNNDDSSSDAARVSCSDFFVQFPSGTGSEAAVNKISRKMKMFGGLIRDISGSNNVPPPSYRKMSSFISQEANPPTQADELSEKLEPMGSLSYDGDDGNNGLVKPVVILQNEDGTKQNIICENDECTLDSSKIIKIRGSVDVQINGKNIPDLAMHLRKNGTCSFVNGPAFLRPHRNALERLIRERILSPGRNTIRYTFHGKKSHYVEAYIFLWNASDSIVISDIDGTVTKSDVGGVVDTIIKESYDYAHLGVCRLYQFLAATHERVGASDLTEEDLKKFIQSRISESKPWALKKKESRMNALKSTSDTRFLYLTSRPISLLESTRKFIYSLKQNEYELPPGPILCHIGSLSQVLYTELILKSADKFKADALKRQVVEPFAMAGKKTNEKLFIASFGNKQTDASAYEEVGVKKDDIYIINTKSKITCMSSITETVNLRSSAPTNKLIQSKTTNISKSSLGSDIANAMMECCSIGEQQIGNNVTEAKHQNKILIDSSECALEKDKVGHSPRIASERTSGRGGARGESESGEYEYYTDSRLLRQLSKKVFISVSGRPEPHSAYLDQTCWY